MLLASPLCRRAKENEPKLGTLCLAKKDIKRRSKMKRHTFFSGLAWSKRDGNTEPSQEVKQKYNEAWEDYLKREIPQPDIVEIQDPAIIELLKPRQAEKET